MKNRDQQKSVKRSLIKLKKKNWKNRKNETSKNENRGNM